MRILMINLPPFLPKKPGNRLYSLQASMNLGMLAVASAADRDGHTVLVYDWLGPQQFPLLEELPAILADFRPEIVGFSIPSGYAEPYLQPFAAAVKMALPNVTIIVGGQYHVGFRASEVLNTQPHVDAVALGSGEFLDWTALVDTRSRLPGIVTRSSMLESRRPQVADVSPFNWRLHGFDLRAYAPSIEIARGCPFNCSFCSLSGAPERLNRSTVSVIAAQLSYWTDVWKDIDRIPLYAECPVFFCNERNVDDYRLAFGPFSERIEWRVQARAESIEPELLPELYDLGLRVVDLGLESASPQMLQLMNKTRNPRAYLEKAARFIEAAADAGIGVKLNLLLYPGEDRITAGETRDFVLSFRDKLAGVAAGSAIEFPGSALSSELPDLERRFGTRRVHDPLLAASGIYPLDLSTEFSYEAARAWCLSLSQEVMNARRYFELKRIGYFAPTVSYDAFSAVAQIADPRTLPFGWEGSDTVGQHEEASVGDRLIQWDKMR